MQSRSTGIRTDNVDAISEVTTFGRPQSRDQLSNQPDPPSFPPTLQAHAHKKGERDVLVIEINPRDAKEHPHQIEAAVQNLTLKGVKWLPGFKVEGEALTHEAALPAHSHGCMRALHTSVSGFSLPVHLQSAPAALFTSPAAEVAFGIKKVVAQCVIEDPSVNVADVTEAIQALHNHHKEPLVGDVEVRAFGKAPF